MTGLRTLEFALEEIASARPVTERVRHFKLRDGSFSRKEIGKTPAFSPEGLKDGRSESGKLVDCECSASSGWLRHIPRTVQFTHDPTARSPDSTPRFPRPISSRKMPK